MNFCMHMYMYMFAWILVHRYTHMYTGQRLTSGVSLSYFPSKKKHDLILNMEFTNSACQARKIPVYSCFHLNIGLQVHVTMLGFYLGAGDLNSGSRACVTNTAE